MGYCISKRWVKFSLPREKFTAALEAVKATASEGNKGRMVGFYSQGGKVIDRYYGFVDMRYVNADDLISAMRCWRWDAVEDDTGIIGLDFLGEKYAADMKVLFEAIAPFVTNKSHIVMEGEDGKFVRWDFIDNKCQEMWFEVDWENLR